MKKKIILIFALFFINVFSIQAEEYNCQYYLKEGIKTGFWGADTTYNFRYIVNTDKKTIRSKKVPSEETANDDWETGEFNSLADTIYGSTYNEKYYVDLLDGKCQSTIYVCKFTGENWFWNTWNTNYSLLFNDTYYQDLINLHPSFYDNGSDHLALMYKDEDTCKDHHEGKNCSSSYNMNDPRDCVKFYYYDGNYPNKGESVDISYQCNKITNDKQDGLLDIVISKADKYKKCKSGKTKNCVSSQIAKEYDEKLEELKSYCKSVIKFQNYGDSCMSDCLGLQDTLKEKDALIDDLNNNTECYLTESIVSMVYNVLKWAKYIAPILVIILSILDFIKAIAAQNDDDMKKAQGKFVKRLIVAALLFLLPLIINFMLKTFGLYNSACDISNLFS